MLSIERFFSRPRGKARLEPASAGRAGPDPYLDFLSPCSYPFAAAHAASGDAVVFVGGGPGDTRGGVASTLCNDGTGYGGTTAGPRFQNTEGVT